ncbi:MAG: flagellar hook basal-body protein [Syntrophobacteraceae bacterium]
MSADLMYTALAGLNTFNTALSVVSDNISNANTTGFKSNTVDFGDIVSGLIATSNAGNAVAAGAGSSVLNVETNFTTGSAQAQTGTWSDLMIQGSGFFSAENASSKAVYYTRDGEFQVNASGDLVDTNGNDVLSSSGKAITGLDPSTYSSFSIDQNGNIDGTAISTGAVTTIGVIGVTTFSNQNGLIRIGENDYTPGGNAGTATTGAAGAGQAGTISSGALEGSNVDLTQQMVNLIDYQADYQACSKAVTTGNNNLQTVVSLIR